MVQIQIRPGTVEERRLVEGWLRSDYAGWVFVGVLFAVIPFLLFGQLGWGLGIAFAPHLAALWRFIGWGIAAVVFYVPIRKFVLRQRQIRSKLADDLNDFQVQEIVVAYCSARQVSIQGSDEPAVLIELDQDRGLLLHGDYLLQHATYGASTASEFNSEYFNGLPSPWSFPSDRFVLTRLPHSGRVLSITIHGEYLAPEKSEQKLPSLNSLNRESSIVEREMARLH